MKKILLIGGTGIISTDITRLAAQRPDMEVYLLNRGNLPQFVPEDVRSIRADINDGAAVRAAIKGLAFDVVADFISYNVDELQRKLDVFRDSCGQYVFVSSCAAYRSPPYFKIITESDTPVGNPLWSYGLNKSMCEWRLAEEHARSGLCYTIVRPAYTYNDIRILHPYTINHWWSWTMARRLLDGKPCVLHDDGQQLCTATHAVDFARAFVGLWGNPAALNEAFHIATGELLTWKRVAELTAEALGVPIRFCCVPAERLCLELDAGADAKIMHTAGHAAYDNAKIRAAVPDARGGMPFADGIARTIRFYLEHPEYQRVEPRWDAAFDRITSKYG